MEFETYFDSGMGIQESLDYHESKLELKFGPESTHLANASINPKYRTVLHWHDKWRKVNLGPRHGVGVLDVFIGKILYSTCFKKHYFQKIKEKQEVYEKEGIIVKYKENPFAVIIVTPIMQRAHNLHFSKDIIFTDSTASCDSLSHSVTFLLTPCGIGAVPLAVIITKGQTIDDYASGYQLIKDFVPNAFCGNGFPQLFVTDDSDAERSALKLVWPESRTLLCRFHVCQAV